MMVPVMIVFRTKFNNIMLSLEMLQISTWGNRVGQMTMVLICGKKLQDNLLFQIPWVSPRD